MTRRNKRIAYYAAVDKSIRLSWFFLPVIFYTAVSNKYALYTVSTYHCFFLAAVKQRTVAAIAALMDSAPSRMGIRTGTEFTFFQKGDAPAPSFPITITPPAPHDISSHDLPDSVCATYRGKPLLSALSAISEKPSSVNIGR